MTARDGTSVAARSANGAQADMRAPVTRIVLVALSTFEWLRQLQSGAPQPRIDMRYLLDGALQTLADDAELQHLWVLTATDTLREHLTRAQSHPADARPTTITGTVLPAADEGAAARTTGASANSARRHHDCRALQIGETAYRCLRDLQNGTYEPRLDFRFLLAGAQQLLDQRSELLPVVIARARLALRDHLTELDTSPVPPFSMESSR